MVDGTFLKELLKACQPQVSEQHGVPFVLTGSGAQMIHPPQPGILKVFSLEPFVRAVAKVEEPVLVNVESHTRVSASLVARNATREIDHLITADFGGVFEDFEEARRMSQEDFITKVQSLFAVNLDREDILKLVGSVKTDAENVTTDDGVTQNVQVKAGVHLSKEMKVRNPWKLLPYKTFPEIPPVEVPYVLRVTRGRDTEFALYEADGSRWKVQTTQSIRDYLSKSFADLKTEHVTVL